MAYMLPLMSRAARLIAAAALSSLAAACATPSGGPPPQISGPPPPPEPDSTPFKPQDFAWAQAKGKSQLAGRVTYAEGQTKYTCAGAQVILTPETPWVKRRMEIMYKSADRSAMPSAEVRARTPLAPQGDSAPFIKRAVCDTNNRFSYAGLADGAWYVITIARPVGKAGDSVALMRRVVTKGGKLTNTEL